MGGGGCPGGGDGHGGGGGTTLRSHQPAHSLTLDAPPHHHHHHRYAIPCPRPSVPQADGWHCGRCRAPRKATKVLQLCRLPPVLILILKRFKYDIYGAMSSKLATAVDLPLTNWDLRPWARCPRAAGEGGGACGPECACPPAAYDLYGVINHFGQPSFGHYTAFCKVGGEWLSFDDSTVSTIQNPHGAANSDAYVLFYRRREPGQEAAPPAAPKLAALASQSRSRACVVL